MPSNLIRFGTSGWRAIIADEFTFENVRLAVAAIAEHVRSRNSSPTLIIGHDTRFFSEEFARAAAEVLSAYGVRVLMCKGPAPTPAIAYEILCRKTDGAINFTASHNPAEYHGLKFSGPDGGPALPEVTRDIEARVEKLARSAAPVKRAPARFETIDLRVPYFGRLLELVDFSVLRAAKLKFVCDVLHGCGAGYLDRILEDQAVEAVALRTDRDVLFDGHGPDVAETNLAPLRQAMLEHRAAAGLATDGDADRFGILRSEEHTSELQSR